MHYRLQKYLTEQITAFIRRVFRYNSSWANKDIELVQFPSGSEQLVFEQFFEENEKYPIVTISMQGGALSHAAFNDLIDIYDADSVEFGSRAQTSVTITDTIGLRVQLADSFLGETVRGVSIYLASTGVASTDDDITVNLYQTFTTSPVLVASGSLAGTSRTGFQFHFCELWPYTELFSTDYWIELLPASGSIYSVGLDTDALTLYSNNSTGSYVTATGSITGKIILPAFIRLGGNMEPTMTIRCMAKNDTAGAYDLAELIAQYLELAKHAEISRASTATNGMVLSDTISEGLSELTQRGIYIKNTRIGPTDMRRRGVNDEIYTVPISVEIFTEWFQDYGLDILKGVEPGISSFS